MLESLGINPLLLIGQIISFGIVFLVLNRFLYPRIRTALDERREAVSKTFADQAAIEARLREFDIEQKAAQRKAAEDVQKLIAEAKESAAAIKSDLVSKARESAAAEFSVAQKRIEQEKINAEAEVAKHAKTLAHSIVQELLSEKAADPKWQNAQIQSSIDQLKKGHE
jgi:F-type H+-transporting ATPase subunit b